MATVYRDERGVHADCHPYVSPFLGTRRNARGECVALFMRSAAEERRMQNGYRPFHTSTCDEKRIRAMDAALAADTGADPAYKAQQRAELARALEALSPHAAPRPPKQPRFYCRWGLAVTPYP